MPNLVAAVRRTNRSRACRVTRLGMITSRNRIEQFHPEHRWYSGYRGMASLNRSAIVEQTSGRSNNAPLWSALPLGWNSRDIHCDFRTFLNRNLRLSCTCTAHTVIYITWNILCVISVCRLVDGYGDAFLSRDKFSHQVGVCVFLVPSRMHCLPAFLSRSETVTRTYLPLSILCGTPWYRRTAACFITIVFVHFLAHYHSLISSHSHFAPCVLLYELCHKSKLRTLRISHSLFSTSPHFGTSWSAESVRRRFSLRGILHLRGVHFITAWRNIATDQDFLYCSQAFLAFHFRHTGLGGYSLYCTVILQYPTPFMLLGTWEELVHFLLQLCGDSRQYFVISHYTACSHVRSTSIHFNTPRFHFLFLSGHSYLVHLSGASSPPVYSRTACVRRLRPRSVIKSCRTRPARAVPSCLHSCTDLGIHFICVIPRFSSCHLFLFSTDIDFCSSVWRPFAYLHSYSGTAPYYAIRGPAFATEFVRCRWANFPGGTLEIV